MELHKNKYHFVFINLLQKSPGFPEENLNAGIPGKNTFKKISCCNNKICLDCIQIWFNKSVFCPFCKEDQRTILDNLNNNN
jgi:hypothetical protein